MTSPYSHHRSFPGCRRPPPTKFSEAAVHHQSNFRPDWTWRDVVEVLVMAPAVGETPEGVKTTALGRLKFARLRRLNISARNCRFHLSRAGMSFSTEKSQVARPGPIN